MTVKLFGAFIKEPVLITNVVGAIIALVVVLGLAVPAGLEAAIAGVIVAVATGISRAFVTPV